MVVDAVESVLFDWGIGTLAERGAAKLPTPFTSRVNDRAQKLGDDPHSIRHRIEGDIALSRARLGPHDFLNWN